MKKSPERRPANPGVETDLREGLAALGIDPDERQLGQLLDYLALLERWNQAYNLTAVQDPREMVSRHLLDSLAVLPWLRGQRFVDLGTGAGLPGIPLAIFRPGLEFVLLDGNGKRIRFLFQVKAALGLGNVREVHSRAEDFRDEAGFDGLLSRAFSSLAEMITCSDHLRAPGGRFYALKGRYPGKELRELPKPYNVIDCRTLAVPGAAGERHLIEIGTSP